MARRLAATALMILIVGGVLGAQQPPAPQQTPAPPQTPEQSRQATGTGAMPDADARETRQQLDRVLERYPPALGRVLKMDPSLLSNQGYLAAYPALASFLASHPEVVHNPGYFLEVVDGADSSWQPESAKTQTIALWRSMFDGFGAFAVFLTVTGALIWLVKTLIEWRRWSRLSRLQAETHTKILDRFATNQDLLAYIETPAGRRFLESGPPIAEGAARPLGAPVSRILWSVQAGVVLAVGGLGLLFVSRNVIAEVAEALWVLGVLTLAVGLGFVVSAVVAYVISRRMGLFDPLFGRRAPGPADAV
jgi:hypothetical protein